MLAFLSSSRPAVATPVFWLGTGKIQRMYVAEKILADVKAGKEGFLFWMKVAGWAHSTRKFTRYDFPDGSFVVREHLDNGDTQVRGSWPKAGGKPGDDPIVAP